MLLTLAFEEFGPGVDVGVLFEESASLTLSHASPDPEFDAIVEGVGAALHEDRAMPTDSCCLALRSTTDK